MIPALMMQQRKTCQFLVRFLLALCIVADVHEVSAQDMPKPVDQPYPGVIELQVDATNLRQKIYTVHERIPVKAGKLTLLYPEWLKGTHSPSGEPMQLAGLIVTGNAQRLEWTRDPLYVFAYHVSVPPGVTTLDVDFQYLSALADSQGAVLATPEMIALHWETLVLYPAGYYSRNILIKPSLTLPANWKFGSALELDGQEGARARFKPVNLDDFIDSPLYAGKYFKRFDLDPGAKVPVYLDLVADHAADLEAKPAQIDMHRALIQQAYKLFGSHHYDHYDFLVAASDLFGFAGLEHHQSGEYGVAASYFTDWDKGIDWRACLIPHEYIHSWDGKFRRPAGQMTPNYNTPMENSLLWVYEGQTEYWGFVLASRSGLLTLPQIRESFALRAASYDHVAGRRWRALQDTTNDPVVTRRRPQGWMSWQREEDYYDEGELIWLDADTRIREMSGDKRSLDDFARGFFGVEDGRRTPLPYTFDDVVKALNAVQPYDWATFLRTRLDSHGPGAPLDGLTRAGWKLVYTETPSDYFRNLEEHRKFTDFEYSLGFSVGDGDRLVSVLWDGPAFKAGLAKGAVLLAVNGRAYRSEILKQAITDAKSAKEPIELLFRSDDHYFTAAIDYHDGLKYPTLERIEGTPDRLEAILQPLK